MRKPGMLTVIYVLSGLYLMSGVLLLIAGMYFAFKKPVEPQESEPDPVWVLHVEEALAEL
jgi:hypothetical protein